MRRSASANSSVKTMSGSIAPSAAARTTFAGAKPGKPLTESRAASALAPSSPRSPPRHRPAAVRRSPRRPGHQVMIAGTTASATTAAHTCSPMNVANDKPPSRPTRCASPPRATAQGAATRRAERRSSGCAFTQIVPMGSSNATARLTPGTPARATAIPTISPRISARATRPTRRDPLFDAAALGPVNASRQSVRAATGFARASSSRNSSSGAVAQYSGADSAGVDRLTALKGEPPAVQRRTNPLTRHDVPHFPLAAVGVLERSMRHA